MEISPEMVRDGIKSVMEKYTDESGNVDKDKLLKELVEHAYSFAELPRPKWIEDQT